MSSLAIANDRPSPSDAWPVSVNAAFLLMVEDSDDDYFVFSRQLQKAGFSSRHYRCGDGYEARDYLLGVGQFADRAKFPLPRLILADLKMPRLDGLELLQWMRGQPFLRRIPFILLSSSDSPVDIAAAYDAFVTAYVLKQGRPEQMIEAFRIINQFLLQLSLLPPVAGVVNN